MLSVLVSRECLDCGLADCEGDGRALAARWRGELIAAR